jgi:hypothetical protein
MNTSYERTKNTSDEWYTPPAIFEKLGRFDLDPCAATKPLWKIADTNYSALDDGLSKPWHGRVWLNPPYSRHLLERFVERMADHGNGIALLFNRCDCKLFQDVIFKKAHGILFLKGRVKFYSPAGEQNGPAGCGSVLVAFGKENAETLRKCDIPGRFFSLQ